MWTTYLILGVTGTLAGLLSGAVGFGGGMIILPVITYFYGIEIAIPIAAVAQMMSNLNKSVLGFKSIEWKEVGRFLLCAAPLTALGAFGFAVAPKQLMTRILCVFLIIFAIAKMAGKFNLPRKKSTMYIGGGITGLINGLLSVSGPLSSAVFLTLDLAPVAYIASEATAAAVMHIIKIIVYGKMSLMNGHIFLEGLFIGAAMMLGNYIAIRTIKNIKKKQYQRIVGICMIITSIFLFFTA